jgi:regulatory protein
VARQILLDQLTGRARSRSDLAAKLAQRNVPEEIAGRLLDRFEEVGLVDDAAFARGWVEQRQSAGGWPGGPSPRSCGARASTTRSRGRPSTRSTPNTRWRRPAALVRRKLRSVSDLDQQVAVRRLTGMLARKGYPPSVAFRVVREELDADLVDPEHLT